MQFESFSTAVAKETHLPLVQRVSTVASYETLSWRTRLRIWRMEKATRDGTVQLERHDLTFGSSEERIHVKVITTKSRVLEVEIDGSSIQKDAVRRAAKKAARED